MPITEASIREFASHVASQNHAMAGATITASAALACGLGGACVNISLSQLEGEDALAAATAAAATARDRLDQIRQQLLALADEDGDAITTYARLRDAGQGLQGQERLTEMPVAAAGLTMDAALLLQDFRPLVRHVQDDLEMAITLLTGAAQAATLLIDSNLRIWPEPFLIDRFEPVLGSLRERTALLQPATRVR